MFGTPADEETQDYYFNFGLNGLNPMRCTKPKKPLVLKSLRRLLRRPHAFFGCANLLKVFVVVLTIVIVLLRSLLTF